jgi:hypothetical protein
MSQPKRLMWALLLPALLCALPAAAQPPATQPSAARVVEAGKYLRYEDNGQLGGWLETADVTFANDHGATVRLVSAVHIGEKSYFESLQKSFTPCDAVLYEMVKPKDAPAPRPGVRSNSTVSQVQRFMKEALNLEFQLDVIDYTRPNFVHADLDAETFTKLQQERGESFSNLMLQSMMQALSRPAPAADSQDADQSIHQLLSLLTRPDPERRVKLLLARQMADMEMGGLDSGTVLVTERNKAAIRALRQQLALGRHNLVIFFGAAHMPDLADRLDLLGFKPVSIQWRTAWNLQIRPDQPSALEKLVRDAEQSLNDLADQ